VAPVTALPAPAPRLKEENAPLVAEERTEPVEERRYPARTHNAPQRWWANAAQTKEFGGSQAAARAERDDLNEPQPYQEAIGGEEKDLWRLSMDDEMRSLLENRTWELVPKPEGVKPVPMKWVYKIKL
jgi:hypothetical protein